MWLGGQLREVYHSAFRKDVLASDCSLLLCLPGVKCTAQVDRFGYRDMKEDAQEKPASVPRCVDRIRPHDRSYQRLVKDAAALDAYDHFCRSYTVKLHAVMRGVLRDVYPAAATQTVVFEHPNVLVAAGPRKVTLVNQDAANAKVYSFDLLKSLPAPADLLLRPLDGASERKRTRALLHWEPVHTFVQLLQEEESNRLNGNLSLVTEAIVKRLPSGKYAIVPGSSEPPSASLGEAYFGLEGNPPLAKTFVPNPSVGLAQKHSTDQHSAATVIGGRDAPPASKERGTLPNEARLRAFDLFSSTTRPPPPPVASTNVVAPQSAASSLVGKFYDWRHSRNSQKLEGAKQGARESRDAFFSRQEKYRRKAESYRERAERSRQPGGGWDERLQNKGTRSRI